MSGDFPQLLIAGVTMGAIYALVALGFSIVYNASRVINFAQGELVMIGGMATVFIAAAGLPLPLAMGGAVLAAVAVGLAIERFGIEPARRSGAIGLVIVTIGASMLIRGLAAIILDRNEHTLAPISGPEPIMIDGVALLPQSLWILGVTAVVACLLWLFLAHTLRGKAMVAAARNPLAARLVGIDTRRVVMVSFALAAALGALAGILITPLAPTHYQVGVMLGLKGFAAAILGGLGSGPGAILGGLVIGLGETLSAGYLFSAYEDVVAFVVLLLVLLLWPRGILGRVGIERV